MQYQVKKPKTDVWTPLETNSLSTEVSRGVIGYNWRIRRSEDSPEMSVLEMAENHSYGGTASAGASGASGSAGSFSSPIHRYRDSYRVANATVAFGGLIKGLGWALGLLTALASLVSSSQTESSGVKIVLIVAALISAAFEIIVFFFFGVVVTALGQNLQASLDTAVHSSPFLDDAEKRQVMGLPKA